MSDNEDEHLYLPPVWMVPVYPAPPSATMYSQRVYQTSESVGVLLTAVPTSAPPSAVINKTSTRLHQPTEFSHPLLRKYDPTS
jgi:hypothetical protein